MAPPEDIQIDVTPQHDDADASLCAWLTEQLGRIAELAGVADASVSVALVGDEQMSDLHGRYMQDWTTTDILTFDLRDEDAPADVSRVDAELVICVDEAARQAARRGHETRMELLLYAVHGLLHCQGYDDHDEAGYAAMHAREDELLRAAGFASVFRSAAGDEPDDGDADTGGAALTR